MQVGSTSVEHNGKINTIEHDQRYDDNFVEGGNSDAVSITSSKLRASTVQLSNNNTNIISSSTREELLEKFGECAECKRPNTGENNCANNAILNIFVLNLINGKVKTRMLIKQLNYL